MFGKVIFKNRLLLIVSIYQAIKTMKNFRIKYSVKGVSGQIEVVLTASSSFAVREIIENQNGGKGNVTFWSVKQE